MWTGPQLVLAQRVLPGPAGDFGDLIPPAVVVHAVLRFERLVADAGCDSEANHRFCRDDLGADSLIPAKKRRSAKVVRPRRAGGRWSGGSASPATRRPAGPTGSVGRPRR